MDYFDTQNEKFYDFLNKTFEINKFKSWDDLARSITLLKVKRTYRVFAKLFPRNFNYLGELEKTRDTFSSIHYGAIKGNKIIDEIVRFSLYSDKIIVFHPLQNPSVTNQRIDPGRNPKYWLPDFLDALYFYIVIQRWVKSGIVKLIVNPYEYNFELRELIDKQVEVRFLKTNKEELYKISNDEIQNSLAEKFATIYKGKSKDYIVKSLLEMEEPIFNVENASKFSEKIIEAFNRINPLYKCLNIDLGGSTMLSPTKGGGPLESIILISEKCGGNIYTASDLTWYQVKDYGLDEFWIKMSRLYSQIPLNFLNNVDTNFVLELRMQDKLSGVRQELRKIYSELSRLNISNIDFKKINLIQEGFVEEIKKSEAEWISIKKQAEISRKYWLSANVGVPFITNDVSILPLALGSLAWLYMNEKTAIEKVNLYKAKNPISVYVDLKNKKQSFVTDLRNCLI